MDGMGGQSKIASPASVGAAGEAKCGTVLCQSVRETIAAGPPGAPAKRCCD